MCVIYLLSLLNNVDIFDYIFLINLLEEHWKVFFLFS